MQEEKIKLTNELLKLLKKKGADDIVLSLAEEQAQMIKFANNKIAKTGSEEMAVLGIFVTKDKKIIETSLKNITKEEIEKTASKIMKFIKNIPKNNDYYGIAKGPFKYSKIDKCYDPKLANINAPQLVELGIETAVSEGAERTNGTLMAQEVDHYLLTSENVAAQDKSTYTYYSIRALTNKAGSGHLTSSSRMLNSLDIEKTSAKAAQLAVQSNNPLEIDQKKYDVLFTPMSASNILDCVGSFSSIFNVECGMSCFKDMLNQQVASPLVTLKDDATLANGLDSYKFDAEGVPSQTTTIIDKGILKSYLHNTSTAKKYKTKSTGNAGLISPSPSNIILQEGKNSYNKLVESMDKGIIITNVWYTRFQDYTKGDFSTIPRDACFLVEDGTISFPIKNIRVSDNIINILKSISDLGSDVVQVKNWETETPIILPSFIAKDINITKPTL